jgi:hypothetical protein
MAAALSLGCLQGAAFIAALILTVSVAALADETIRFLNAASLGGHIARHDSHDPSVMSVFTKKMRRFDLAQIPPASVPGKNKHVLYQSDSAARRETACDWLYPLDSLLASNRIDGISSNLIDSFRLWVDSSSYYFFLVRFSCHFFCNQRMVSTVDHRNSSYRPQSDRKDRAHSKAYR